MPKFASTHLARILRLSCILGVFAASTARAAVSRDATVVTPNADGEPGAPVEPSTGDSPSESDLFLGTYSKRIAILVPSDSAPMDHRKAA